MFISAIITSVETVNIRFSLAPATPFSSTEYIHEQTKVTDRNITDMPVFLT